MSATIKVDVTDGYTSQVWYYPVSELAGDHSKFVAALHRAAQDLQDTYLPEEECQAPLLNKPRS